MSDTVTGGVTQPNLFSAPGIVKNTIMTEGRCQAYDRPYAQSAKEVAIRTVPRQRPHKGMSSSALLVSERSALTTYLQKAVQCAENMEYAVNEQDAIGIAIAGNGLIEFLNELWRLRTIREREWQKVLNFLQSALSKVVFEELTPEQCRGIRTTVVDFLAAGALTKYRTATAIRIMREAGLDIWKGISAKRVSEG